MPNFHLPTNKYTLRERHDALDERVEDTKSDIAVVENGNTTTHEISKAGVYIIWKDQLYKSKGAIGIGTDLTQNTSSYLDPVLNGLGGEVKSLSDQIATLNSSLLNTEFAYTNDILVDAVSCTTNAFFKGDGGNYTGTVPDSYFKYGVFLVIRRNTADKHVLALAQNGLLATNIYSGSWSGWKVMATGQTYNVTPTANTSVVQSGTIACNVINGICYVHLDNIVFKQSGNSQIAFTGLPKAAMQGQAPYDGSNASNNGSVRTAGDGCWVSATDTNLRVNLGSTYGLSHYCSFCYPVA